VKQFANVVRAFVTATEDKGNDFVEGLVYSRDRAVIMTGQLTDDLELDKVTYFTVPPFMSTLITVHAVILPGRSLVCSRNKSIHKHSFNLILFLFQV